MQATLWEQQITSVPQTQETPQKQSPAALEISVSTMCIPDQIWHTLLIQLELAASLANLPRPVGAGCAHPGNHQVI